MLCFELSSHTRTFFGDSHWLSVYINVAKRASGINCDDPAIQESWNSLRSDDDPHNWLWLHLVAATAVGVKSTGSGGAQELIATASDDEILFGALRVNISEGASKFFHVYFVGANVNGMKKGKASMYESGIFQSLEGGHGKLTFNGLEDLTIENITEAIFKLTKQRVPL
jgi:hypothetical protein